MRKRRVLTLGIVTLLCGSLIFGGCGKKEAPAEEETSKEDNVEEEKEEEEPEEEILAVIGTEAEGENIYKVTLENKTGKNIVGFSVKDSAMAEYPANMLPEGEVFAADEKRNLFYDSASIQEAEQTEEPAESGEDEKLLNPQIDVQLTFEDETVMVLTAFPFGDVEEGGIYLEDEVAFIQYESVSSKESVSTKEAELTIKEQKQAEAEAAAAAEAEAQRQAEEAAAAAEAQRQAEAAAAAEAQRQAEAAAAAQRQRQQQKQQQAPSNSGGGGCVNDGLVY